MSATELVAKNILYVVLYCFSSILITLYVKYSVSYSGIRAPLTMLCIQMGLNGLICMSFGRITGLVRQTFDVALLKRLLLVGVLTAVDYGLSNTSFLFITVSLYTMLKSATPIFILLFSFVLGVETISALLIASIAFISGGIIIAAASSVDVDWRGVLCLAGAILASATRHVFAQTVLQHGQHTATGYRQPELQNAVDDPKLTELEELITAKQHTDDSGPLTNQQQNESSQPPANGVEATEAQSDSESTVSEDDDEDDDENEDIEASNDNNGSTVMVTSNSTPSSTIYYYLAKSEQDHGGLSPLEVFSYIAPITCITLLPFALVIEAPVMIPTLFDNPKLFGVLLLIILGGLVFGIMLNLSEYLLIKRTSSLTASIIGIVKELLLIGLSVLIFKDQLTALNIVGYSICIGGLVMYQGYRYKALLLAKLRSNSAAVDI